MSTRFRLSGKVTHVGRQLELNLAEGAPFQASVQLDESKSDEAAVTPLIGTYPGAVEAIEADIGGALSLTLQSGYLSKVSKRIDEPYAYILEAQLVGTLDGAEMRGTLEIILTQRCESTPASDDDSLAPPVIAHYRDRRWRIWLAVTGRSTDKIEGLLDA